MRKFAIAVLVLTVTACQTTREVDDPKVTTHAEFAKLKWLEGTWVGSGIDQAPFFERYHFINDSTLIIESFSDATLSKVTETSEYGVRNGKLGNAHPRSRWEATALTDRSVTFGPVAGVRNSFIWRYETPNTWTAIILHPADATRPARERVYNMVRMR